MDSRTLPSGHILKRLTCATIHPSEGGAVVRFYMRQDSLLIRNGSWSVGRAETLGEIELKGDEFRPRKPRRLYEVTIERTRLGGERDG